MLSKYLKITLTSLLLVVVSLFLFLQFNLNQLEDMKRVSNNIVFALNTKLVNAVNSIEYLNLSATQLIQTQQELDMKRPLYTTKKGGHYCYSLYEKDSQSSEAIDKANLLGWTDDAKAQYFSQEQTAIVKLSNHLKMVYKKNKDFAWVYYFSKKHFTLIYPYISAEDYIFGDKLEKLPFYHCATPALNPNRELFFTPLYMDAIGKGLMITIGKPVYKDDEFMGTIDIDITLNNIDNLLSDLDVSKNKSIVYNNQMQIFGSSNLIKDFNRSKIYNAKEYLSSEILALQESKDAVRYVDGKYLIIKKIENTPFTFIYFQEASSIWLHSFLYLLPIIFVLGLFILIAYLYNKSRLAMSKLQEQVSKDYLTGAFNRRYFFEVANPIFLKSKRKKAPLAVVMLDIDDFKKVNDTYGHKAGDLGIISVKEILEKNLRKSDLFARFGGEEFCILLEDISLENTENLMEKIRKEFETNVLEIGGRKFSFTVSFGVAYGVLDSLENMINLSDKALYQAKKNGKNRVSIYTVY